MKTRPVIVPSKPMRERMPEARSKPSADDEDDDEDDDA
jgi:hypothetical protein